MIIITQLVTQGTLLTLLHFMRQKKNAHYSFLLLQKTRTQMTHVLLWSSGIEVKKGDDPNLLWSLCCVALCCVVLCCGVPSVRLFFFVVFVAKKDFYNMTGLGGNDVCTRSLYKHV